MPMTDDDSILTAASSNFDITQTSTPIIRSKAEQAKAQIDTFKVSELHMLSNPAIPIVAPTFYKSTNSKNLFMLGKKDPNEDRENAKALKERCRQLCLASFFRESSPIRSLGLTSSIGGEGKTFLSVVIANVLASDSSSPVTLLECNWDHPCFHKYFNIAEKPGLAEWLRGECPQEAIRHTIDGKLSVIPAGDGRKDAVKLVQRIHQAGLLDMFNDPNEKFVVELPPVLTSAYGELAASLVESLVVVSCAGVTTDVMLAKTFEQLKHLSIQAIILNQVESHIPHWLRQML